MPRLGNFGCGLAFPFWHGYCRGFRVDRLSGDVHHDFGGVRTCLSGLGRLLYSLLHLFLLSLTDSIQFHLNFLLVHTFNFFLGDNSLVYKNLKNHQNLEVCHV